MDVTRHRFAEEWEVWVGVMWNVERLGDVWEYIVSTSVAIIACMALDMDDVGLVGAASADGVR